MYYKNTKNYKCKAFVYFNGIKWKLVTYDNNFGIIKHNNKLTESKPRG